MSGNPQKRTDTYNKEAHQDPHNNIPADSRNITDISGSSTRRRLKNDATRLGQTAQDIANEARREYSEGRSSSYYADDESYPQYRDSDGLEHYGQRPVGKRYDERSAFNSEDRDGYYNNLNSSKNKGSAYRDGENRLHKAYPQYDGPNPLSVFLRSLLAFLALAALLWIFFLIYNANNTPIRPAAPGPVITDRVTTDTTTTTGDLRNNGTSNFEGNGASTSRTRTIDANGDRISTERSFQNDSIKPTNSPIR